MSTASPKIAKRFFSSCVPMIWSEVNRVAITFAPLLSANDTGPVGRRMPLASLCVPTFLGTTISSGAYSRLSEPASPDDRIKLTPAAFRQLAMAKSKDLIPMPVRITQTVHPPIWTSCTSAPPDQWSGLTRTFLNALRARQGANSASTANVTRMRISIKLRCQTIARLYKNKDTGLKTGHYKTLGRGAGHALGAALGDVAVGFVPAYRALQRCGYRPRP